MAATICMNSRACGENCACAKIGECLHAVAVTPIERVVLKVFGGPAIIAASAVIVSTAFVGGIALVSRAGWLY